MAALIWDNQKQAFAEPVPPLTYNPAIDAWQDTEGYEHNSELEAWEKVWPTKLYLYKDGDECVDITGGWKAANGNITRDGVNIVYTSSANYRNSMASSQQIDLAYYRFLYIHYTTIAYTLKSTTDSDVAAIVCNDNGIADGSIEFARITLFNNVKDAYFPTAGNYNDITICLDVSDCSLGCIVPVKCNQVAYNSTRSITAIIDKIWLE